MGNTQPSIILVDDDRELVSLLSEYLQQEGFNIDSVYDGQAAVDKIQNNSQYDAIVLDIMMPYLSGLDVLQILRQRINTPIIMLTGRGDDIDRIIGLEMGADDYLGKPCNPRELLARLRSVIRRSQLQPPPQTNNTFFESHGIQLDTNKQEVTVDQRPLELTGAEFNVLRLLMTSAGTTISKEELTRLVLHRELTAYDRSIDVHVSRIRKKLENALDREIDFIKAIRGQGYLFTQ